MSKTHLVERIAAALQCTHDERNALLAAAGFLPSELQRIPFTDPELLLVARLLDRDTLSPGVQRVVRDVVRSFAPLMAFTADRRVTTSSPDQSRESDDHGIQVASVKDDISSETVAT